LLACVVAGTALGSLVFGAVADQVGRRRCYALVFLGMAVAGGVLAAGAPVWLIAVLALLGVLSTDVVDNGPATTLEQVMLSAEHVEVTGRAGARVYGLYNAVASLAGAAGALAAGLPDRLGAPAQASWPFAVLVPLGLAGAWLGFRLTPSVETSFTTDPATVTAPHPATEAPTVAPSGLPRVAQAVTRTSTRRIRDRLLPRLGPSRAQVRRLAALFAVDAGGGGLVTASFLAYYLTVRYDATPQALGLLFFTTQLLQAVSVWVAPRLADRIGLVPTMVATHLPSNVLLAAVAFAPSFPVAVGLLLARTCLSQMDVPTRQALVMAVVEPEERSAAAAVTNAARYTVRPFGPLLGGLLQTVTLGLPLLVAGAVKGCYDLALWRWSRQAPR
jgi:MFS family permease